MCGKLREVLERLRWEAQNPMHMKDGNGLNWSRAEKTITG